MVAVTLMAVDYYLVVGYQKVVDCQSPLVVYHLALDFLMVVENLMVVVSS
jgi:hypothetical protein